ncbi:MAG: NAD(P)-binding protein, partial [Myxococcota bacterium]
MLRFDHRFDPLRRTVGLGLSLCAALALLSCTSSADEDLNCESCDTPRDDVEELCLSNITDPSPDVENETFDYIVVGAGAGGAPLASRLAEGGYRVLLLDAGEDPCEDVTYQVAAWHALSTESPMMAWFYFVSHYLDDAEAANDPARDPKGAGQPGILYPRAGALGGCTAHNAQISVAPHDSDWDGIAAATGDSDWSARNMQSYNGRVHDWLGQGKGNPLLVAGDSALTKILLGAAEVVLGETGNLGDIVSLLGDGLRDDSSDPGMYNIPLAITRGRRSS